MSIALVVALATTLAADTVAERFPPPAGFTTPTLAPSSFGASLRRLPLLPTGAQVLTFDGKEAHAPWAQAVVDLDVGTQDLQQCADSAIRLWAEHRFARGDVDNFAVHATSGDLMPWRRWADGERPRAVGHKLVWTKPAAPSRTRETFRAYLDAVFMWAGSRSLAKDTVAVDVLAPGDLLVVGGSPGHVLVVLDVATKGNDERVLLGQGFMPAQSFHVLGWFSPDDDGAFHVPSWPAPFPREARRRFQVPSRT